MHLVQTYCLTLHVLCVCRERWGQGRGMCVWGGGEEEGWELDMSGIMGKVRET